MRPQHITAENEDIGAGSRITECASMRPQHITAENPFRTAGKRPGRQASMRPQHITAENRGAAKSASKSAALQ